MARFGVKEISDVTLYNILTGKAELFLDSLKMSNLEQNAETVYANGGSGNPRLVGFDFNRTATFNIQDALLNPKAIAMQVGTELETKIETIYKRQVAVSVLNGTDSEITLAHAPVGDVTLYKSADGYGHDEEIPKLSMTVVGTDVAVPLAELPERTQVIAYYKFLTTADAEVITVKSDKFAGFYKVVGDTTWRNEKTSQDEMVQIVIEKAKISSQFTLTMQPDGEPSVFDFNLDIFKDPKSTDMVKFIRYTA